MSLAKVVGAVTSVVAAPEGVKVGTVAACATLNWKVRVLGFGLGWFGSVDPITEWFSPSESSFRSNDRVDNKDEMIEQLRSAGVAIQPGPESHVSGVFLWSAEPDENKVELRDPKT